MNREPGLLVPTPMLGHILDSPEGRRWLSRFTEAFAEGKEVGPEVAAGMVAWLVEERPVGPEGTRQVLGPAAARGVLSTRLGGGSRRRTSGNSGSDERLLGD